MYLERYGYNHLHGLTIKGITLDFGMIKGPPSYIMQISNPCCFQSKMEMKM